MPPRARKTEEPINQPEADAVPVPEDTPAPPEAEQPPAPETDPAPPAVDDTPAVPGALPEGFAFNVSGQQWCPACLPRGLDPSATSFACDHGAWQGQPVIFAPPAA